MKPDWKDAPEWARWLAMDEGWEWTWFEFEPNFYESQGAWVHTRGKLACAYSQMIDCKNSLERRPGSE